MSDARITPFEVSILSREDLEDLAISQDIAIKSIKIELERLRNLSVENIELKTKLEKIQEDSFINQQTGLYNSRYLFDKLFPDVLVPNISGERRNSKEIFVFGFMDIDGLDKLNNEYGHDIGDYMIEIVAEVLKNEVRNTDIVGRRYETGDEFYVLLRLLNNQAIDLNDTIETFKDRCRRQISLGSEGLMDISSGFVEVTTCKSPEEVMREADHEMYKDKKIHRDFKT